MQFTNTPFMIDSNLSYSIDNQISTALINHHTTKVKELIQVEGTLTVICQKGVLKCRINAVEYIAEAPCLLVTLSKHFIEVTSVSGDFNGMIVSMTEAYAESLDLQDRLLLYVSIVKNSCVYLTKNELNALEGLCTILRRLSENHENPLILESSKHLMKAYYYGLGSGLFLKKTDVHEKKTSQELLINNFLELVQQNYRHQRKLQYYSNKLHLTPKHLSKVIKERTGYSANEWITKFVLREAKTLLKSTGLTVQQVSDHLNFPSQSFFGKYFKKNTGTSPREYRSKKIA